MINNTEMQSMTTICGLMRTIPPRLHNYKNRDEIETYFIETTRLLLYPLRQDRHVLMIGLFTPARRSDLQEQIIV